MLVRQTSLVDGGDTHGYLHRTLEIHGRRFKMLSICLEQAFVSMAYDNKATTEVR